MVTGEIKMTTELIYTALLFYAVSFAQLSCFGWVIFNVTPPVWLRVVAAALAITVSYKVVVASSSLIGYLLS